MKNFTQITKILFTLLISVFISNAALAQCVSPVFTSIGNSGPVCTGGTISLNAAGTVGGISSGFIRMAGIGANYGNNAFNQVFSSGDRAGSIARISIAQFDAIFAGQPTDAARAAALKAQYDVLMFTWASDTDYNITWSLITAYLSTGGSVFVDGDYNNVYRLNDGTSNSVVGVSAGTTYGCNYTLVSPAPFPSLVANGVNGCFANDHLYSTSWPTWMKPYITASGRALAIAGIYPGGSGGRLIVQGPDQDFHAYRGGNSTEQNQYQICLNQIDFLKANQSGITWTGPNGFTSNDANATITNITAANAGVYTATLTNTTGGGCFVTATTTVVVTPVIPTITAAGPTNICPGSSVTLTASAGTSYNWSNGATTQSIVASTAGNYTVTVTNTGGCSGTSAPIAVIVNPPPVSAITASGPTTICQGDSVILKSSGSNLGNALNLNGAGGYVDVPPTSSITNLGKTGYTLEAWIKPSSISDIKSIVRKDGDYNFYLNNGTVAAEAWVNGTGTPTMHKVTGTVQNVTVGTWTHVAATWDPAANTMSIYINGVAIPTTTVVESVNASGNFLIGVSQTYGQPFAGEVDELRIWNTPRTAAQIADYRNSFISAGTPGLAAYYKFDEGTGTTTADATGNGNNGTLEPGASWVVPSDVPVTYSNYLWSTGATTASITVKTPGNYTLTVKDANGCSSALASQTVTVNPLPVATITAGGPTTFCPSGAVTLKASLGSSYLWSTGATTQEINVTSTGNYSVTVTNDNSCSATSAPTAVLVQDIVSPVFTSTQANTIVALDAITGTAVLADYASAATATDNCSVSGITQFPLAGTALVNSVPTTVTLTAADPSGNTATQSFTVTATDQTPPVVLTKNITVYLDASGNATITPASVDNGSKDNVGITAYNLSPSTFDCTNVGANTVHLTLSDAAGNQATGSATVTVQDTTKPTAIAQNITVQLDATGHATITPSQINNGSTDNCAIATYALDKTTFDCSNVGANPVILTVTDTHGNFSTASAVVTVQDNVPPVVVTQNITVQLDATGNATITAAQINNGSTDNCAIATYALDKTTFDCSNVGANNVILTVTDVHGNASTGTAVVTVQDNIPPVVITQNITVYLSGGNATITPAQIDNGSNDACGIKSMSLDKTSFDCSTQGAITVTLTVTDNHGNVSTGTAVVTVIGKTPTPSIAVSRTDNTDTKLDANTIALGYGAQQLTLTASNPISPNSSTYSWSPSTGLSNTNIANPVFTPTQAGSYTFTVLVTSEYGCQASASVTITVIDVRCGDDGKKVAICFKTTGKGEGNGEGDEDSKSGKPICVSTHAVAEQLEHGGNLCACACQINNDGNGSDGSGYGTKAPVTLTAYPNPFDKRTTVSFTVPSAEQNVTLDVYDAMGRKVATLYAGRAGANQTYSYPFDGTRLMFGVYFARLTTSSGVYTFRLSMRD